MEEPSTESTVESTATEKPIRRVRVEEPEYLYRVYFITSAHGAFDGEGKTIDLESGPSVGMAAHSAEWAIRNAIAWHCKGLFFSDGQGGCFTEPAPTDRVRAIYIRPYVHERDKNYLRSFPVATIKKPKSNAVWQSLEGDGQRPADV